MKLDCVSEYIYGWKNNPKRQSLYGKRCKALARGKKNSVLVEFENGDKEVVSRNALRKPTQSFKGNLKYWSLVAWLLKDELGKKSTKPIQPSGEEE